MENEYEIFMGALLKATALIAPEFFDLQVASTDATIYRERVYCYELYHQLRQTLPIGFPFTLQGEIDKRNHPIISKACGAIKPDLLVHRPGDMENSNLVVVEVKSVTNVSQLKKDFKTLRCMTSLENGYFRGISVLFGQNNDDPYNKAARLYKKHCADATERIHLFFHKLPRNPIERYIEEQQTP
ncbi:MAG: methionyl-tRNA formyltransferase-like protein [Thermodesulfobacteriota bacterium]